jgi:hypothetical protein
MRRAGLLLTVCATATLLLSSTAAQAARGPAALPAMGPPIGPAMIAAPPGLVVAPPAAILGKVFSFHGLVNTTKCLGIFLQSTENRAPLTHLDCSGLTFQQFRMFDAGPESGFPTYLIQNINSLRCLGIRDGTTAENPRVEQDWCDTAFSVRGWVPFLNNDGTFTFCSAASLRFLQKWQCLDIPNATPLNTAKVWTYSQNSSNAQKFLAVVRG